MDVRFGDCENLDWVSAIKYAGDVENCLGLRRSRKEGRNAQFNVDEEILADNGIPSVENAGTTQVRSDFGVFGLFNTPLLCMCHKSFENSHIFLICGNAAETIQSCHIVD